MKKIIENVRFMQAGTMVFGDLHLENGFVKRIDYKTSFMDSDILIPGFVDLHTHGFRGRSADTTVISDLHALAEEYPKRGVTAFCATLKARSLSEYETIILAYKEAFMGEYRGARFVGFHLEGPYLNMKQAGAIDQQGIQSIQLAELDAFLAKYHDDIKIMTIAPELPFAQEAISLLRLYGVEVSLGHTLATYEETMKAFDLGANQITHLGNTMPMINHRKAGMMDAIFLSNCNCEIIMDEVHLQKEMLQWVIKLLGSKRVIAISDHIECGSLPSGSHRDLLDTFIYLYKTMQYDLSECLEMCCTNASKVVKRYVNEAVLGKRIDFIVLDTHMQIKDVFINGRSVL